jgi:hypothetical protein
MKKLLIVLIFLVGTLDISGQPCTKIDVLKSDTIFFSPEKAAHPAEGWELYLAWFSNHMDQKLKSHDEGSKKRVFVSFIVDKRGQQSNFKVEKGVGNPYDDEAIRLVKKHPHKWYPGQCGTRDVKTKVISFVWF